MDLSQLTYLEGRHLQARMADKYDMVDDVRLLKLLRLPTSCYTRILPFLTLLCFALTCWLV